MELSIRLQAVADLVTAGFRLADIGTDHAYIPIYLAERGKIPGAVAMDVNRGPLQKARENIAEHGLSGRIDARLSDGFASLQEGECESAVIAGMGGPLMIRILKEGLGVVNTLKECILQPQSEIEKMRAFLLEEGFFFIKENMVEESGKYYPMMKVLPPAEAARRQENAAANVAANAASDSSGAESGAGSCEEAGAEKDAPAKADNGMEMWDDVQLRYGRLLLESRNPVLREYLEKEAELKENLLKKLEHAENGRALKRKEELAGELECARKGMKYYEMQ